MEFIPASNNFVTILFIYLISIVSQIHWERGAGLKNLYGRTIVGLHRIVNLPDIQPPDIRWFFFYRIPDIRPDIRPRYPATGYPVMAGYPAKSALKIKFLPEFRAFNYQIQYKVVSAGISTFYSILTVVNLIWKKYVLFDQQSFSVEFHKVSVLVYENEPVSVFREKSVSEVCTH